MSSVKDTGKNGKKGGKTGLIVGVTVAIIVILVLIGVIVVLLVSRKDDDSADNRDNNVSEDTEAPRSDVQERRDVVVTEDNVAEIAAQLAEEEYTPPGYYTVTQNYEWHFGKGGSASDDAHVENVVGNTNDVYFDLFLADDEENPIYKSPVIPIGGVLEGFALDTPLDAGSYDCIMEYHLVDENQDTISTVSVTVTAIVGE